MADEKNGPAKRHRLDFTNVRESSGINPVRVEEGDYGAKITTVTESDKDGTPMWCFVFQLEDRATATYPYYCKLQENQLWKVRNLLIAAGKVVPKKAVNVDPNNLVGTKVGITLTDDEYEGKPKSVIDAVFPYSELAADDPDDGDSAGADDLSEGDTSADDPDEDGDLDLDDL